MKIAGHLIHPMLIVFPLGLLTTAVVFDLIGLVWGQDMWYGVAYWMIVAGIVGGLLAAVFGVLDYVGLPRNTRARAVGLYHGVGNVVVMVLFIASWLLRRPDPLHPGTGALLLSFVGLGLALVTGWLGGELVQRLGVGVDEGANLNAPSSLATSDAKAPGRRRAA
ncbi:MAG TPA: DUF2231 domain-containing protein [Methylomirabilota bacterium]|nr:DUF2231 domain-containing protein [Methylomirabilota bacterium]